MLFCERALQPLSEKVIYKKLQLDLLGERVLGDNNDYH